MKSLSNKESKRLVWSTWLEIMFAGIVVYMSTNPEIWYGMVIAGLILLYAMISFWKKADRVKTELYSVTPVLFLPTAFFACIVALGFAFFSNLGILNSYSQACAVVCLTSAVLSIPESYYADYC
jgi:hypothetical protein